MQSLPLSWALRPSKKYSNEHSEYIFRNMVWVPFRTLETRAHFYNFIAMQSYDNLIIRGCNKYHAKELTKCGFASAKIGMEAILETKQNHFKKKSLIALVKRGLRNGYVKQFPYSLETLKMFNNLKLSSVHSHKPQLQNLFQTNFTPNNLLYAFVSNQNEWLGAILLSVNSNVKLHTELILRKSNAPSGVIEAIIKQIFDDAKTKNIKELSLGEVPFVLKDNNKTDNFKIFLAVKLGSLFKFAYNYKGLYNFKNKFNPRWEFVYLSVKPKLKIKHLVFLFLQSNLHNLILYQTKEIIKNKLKTILNKTFFLFRLLDFN